MSFLLAPLLLIITGALIVYISVRFILKRLKSELVRDHLTLWLSAGALAVFWGMGISLFLNLEWTRWLWELCGAESGLDLMLNSKVFAFDSTWPITSKTILGAAILLFCMYPFWLWLGLQVGYILFGAHEKQTGFIGLLFFKEHPHALPPPPGWSEKKGKSA